MAAASLLIAVAAAGCNAASSVLQRKANRDQPAGQRFGAKLLRDLLRHPQWLLGGVAMIASFLLQATALNIGELSSVEPMLVLELPLTFILASIVFSHRLHVRDWIGSALMAAGLAVFIVVLNPSGGDANAISGAVAAAASASTAAGIVVLVAVGRLMRRPLNSALYGIAAGSGFGLTASLIKVAVTRLTKQGPAAAFGAWETYGFVVAGVASVILIQAALHAGTLIAAQPGITLFDPLVSLLWGTVVLGETTRTGPIVLVAALGGLAVVGGVMLLVRSSTAHVAALADLETVSG